MTVAPSGRRKKVIASVTRGLSCANKRIRWISHGEPIATRAFCAHRRAMSLDVTVEKFAPERMSSLIGALAGRSNRPRRLPDESIATILNRSGKSTGRSNSWTRGRVCALRQHQRIAPYREGERAERGEVTLNEAASALSVSPSTILRMLRNGALPAQQLCKGAPWIIRSQDIKREDVRREAEARRSRRPPSHDPR